jgi:hypothetical protein
MTRIGDASKVYLGTATADKVYVGVNAVWSSVPPTPIAVSGTPTTGTAGSGLTATITMPTHSDGDYLLLFVSRNNADVAAWAGSAGASVTLLADPGGWRLPVFRVTPVPGATTFVLTATVAALWSWCCIGFGAANPTVYSALGSSGNDTSSAMSIPAVTVPTTTGSELQIVAAGTNSTAVWTGATGFTQRVAATAAPGLYVGTKVPTSGLTSVTAAGVDRGNNATTRFESSLALMLRP